MKIFVTTKNLNIGGVETSLVFLLNKLSREGNEIDLMVYEGGSLIDKLDNNINIMYYKDYFGALTNDKLYILNKNILVTTLYKKYKNVINKKYDISIAYNGFDNYFDMIAASVDSEKKLIWVHNDFYSAIKHKKFSLLYKIMYKKMGQKFKFFDNIICVSKYTEQNFNKLFGYNDKSMYCHNYIDGQYILDLSKNETKIKMDKTKFNIVSVGRLTKLKNFDKVIFTSKLLKEKDIKFHTHIIGDGEEYNNLKQLIIDYDLEDCVSLLGNQSIELYSIMKQADLLLSMSAYESFGNVLIEGMILGLPYISNINSGSRDIYENLTPHSCGLIIENDKVLDAILNAMKSNNKNVVFDIEKYNNDIDDKLKKIIN